MIPFDGRVAERCAAAHVACRGPKPLAALKRYGVAAHVMTAKPHTSDELVDALARIDLDRRRVALVHYGERHPALSAALRGMGARVTDICAYEWMLPDDVEPLVRLVDRVVAGQIDALLVTSQIQYRHLCEVAARADREQRLNIALRTRRRRGRDRPDLRGRHPAVGRHSGRDAGGAQPPVARSCARGLFRVDRLILPSD